MRVNTEVAVILSLIFLTALLSLYALDRIPDALYYDEITSAYFPYLSSQRQMDIPLTSLVISVITGEYFVYGAFGPSAFWIRLPSAVYGIAFVVACWLLARSLFGTRIGLTAGFLAFAVPWAFYFRRWGSTTSMAFVFYISLAVYLLVMYFKTCRSLFRYSALGCLVISFYTHAMALFFNFIFFPLLFASRILLKKNERQRIYDMVLLCTVLVLGALPLFITYASTSTAGISGTFFRTSLSKFGGLQLVTNVAQIGLSHLSPDFLVISGGRFFGLASLLYFYGSANGSVGVLSVYGVLFYVWLFLLILDVKKKRLDLKSGLLLWWVISYAIASGFVYYDNPNAARNIVGLTSFILAMSLPINRIYQWMSDHVHEKRFLVAIKVSFVIALLVPVAHYVNLYFNVYSQYEVASSYPDIHYKDLATFLTDASLWGNPLIINSPPEYVQELRFYSNSVGANIKEGDVVHALSTLYSQVDTSVVYYIEAITPKLEWSGNCSELAFAQNSEIVYSSSSPSVPIFLMLNLSKDQFSERDLQIDYSKVVQSKPWHAAGSGDRGDLILSVETSTVKSGRDSLGIMIPPGNYSWAGFNYYFEAEENWENETALSLWEHGTNSGVPLTIGILCEGGRFLYTIWDTFEGWRTFVIPFEMMTQEESPLISHIEGIGVYSWGTGQASIFVDEIALISYQGTDPNG